MANRRFIDFPIAASVGNNDIVLIWQDGLNKQTTKATLLQGSPQSLAGLTDVDIAGLINGQILQYNSTTSKWENVDRTDIFLSQLGDVTIVAPSNGQVLVYNSSTGKWENSSGGYVPYTGAVTTVNLGAQSILAGSFVKAGGTAAQFLKANGSVDSTAYGTGSVTSVALTMPTAFSVAGSPITTAGTLAVTGAGTVGQYIRGDGSLADFPATTGGGSSVSYYLNGSVSQGTIGGVAYRELNRTPIFGAGTDFTIAADGYIASFITDANDPNQLLIPAGNWNFETYFSSSSSGGTPSFYVELYKYDGSTFTLIASNSTFPEFIAFGTIVTAYYSTLAVPTTTLALTDRLAIRYYVVHSGRTITLHTEDNHLCQIITTFTTGLTALNGLTAQVQNFAVGTAGTDFAIASATATHTFNLPTASATNRGALSSADWTTFNGKTSNLGTVTSVGLSSATSGVTIGSTPITTSGTITLAISTASGSQNGLLSSTDWTTFNGKQNALTNPVTGTGASGQVAYFTGTSAISSESNLFWDATNDRLGIGTNVPATTLEVNGVGLFTGGSLTGNTKTGIYIYDTVIVSLAGGNARALQIQAQTLSFFTGATYTEKLKVFENGNVVISTSPSDAGFKLDVNGTGRFSGALRATEITAAMPSGNGALYINNSSLSNKNWTFIPQTSSSETDLLLFYTGASAGTRLTVTNGGNVGIGTSSPTLGILHLLSSSNTTQIRLGGTTSPGFIYANETNQSVEISSGRDGTAGTFPNTGIASSIISLNSLNSNSFITFNTTATNNVGPTERMRITSAGQIQIVGTAGTLRLGTNAGDFATLNYSGGGTSLLNEWASTSAFVDVRANGVGFRISGTGNATLTGTLTQGVSDKRFKKNIKSINNPIEKLKSINGYTFEYDLDNKDLTFIPKEGIDIGVIAQEIQLVIPEAVSIAPSDRNVNGLSKSGKNYLTVNYEKIIPLLIESIKELKKEIDTLKN
jgi:hypothetical protein